MELAGENVLFFTRTMHLGGTENVILQLCEVFKPLVNKIVVCSCGGVNTEKLTEMGIRHYEIIDISEKKFFTVFKNLRSIKLIIKNEEISVVHSHHRMAVLYARLLCGTKITRIANAHSIFYDKKRMTKIAYAGTAVIAVGEQVKRNLLEYFGLSESQVAVIHNAAKPFDGQSRTIAELDKARKEGYTLVGSIGRLSVEKGMEYFIQAAAKVIEQCPNVKFYIVGDGENAGKLEAMATKLLPEGALTFMGYRSDIQNVMRQLDFLVLSSLWEGFPLTPIEAFSVGKTIVATAVGGTVEIVKDGINGYLVEPKCVERIAENVIQLIKHPDIRMRFEKNARQTYLAEFSFEQYANRMIEYYQSL